MAMIERHLQQMTNTSYCIVNALVKPSVDLARLARDKHAARCAYYAANFGVKRTVMSRATAEAYAFIREQILSGKLAPGSQIKEEILADLCGVSRTPVRDALKQLELEYLVRRVSQRTFVCEWSRADAADLFSLRALLEGYAAARAAERRSASFLAVLRHHHAAIGAALDSQSAGSTHFAVEDFIIGNRLFHRAIFEAAGSPRLSETMLKLIVQPVALRTVFTYSRADALQSHYQHADLINAIELGDAMWARAAMTAHLQRAAHALADTAEADVAANGIEGSF
jgi:DNA-binding GntR family transcriptional regulator